MPKQKTLEERWKEEGEGLHVVDEDDPFLESDDDLELDEDDGDDEDAGSSSDEDD
jgi:hypothetical protein